MLSYCGGEWYHSPARAGGSAGSKLAMKQAEEGKWAVGVEPCEHRKQAKKSFERS